MRRRPPRRTVAEHCFHCGQPAQVDSPTLRIDGREARFCCRGCLAASQWISEAGLADYYRLRSAEGARIGEEAADFSAWDRDDVIQAHSRPLEAGREITLLVEGMRCAACAWLIGRALDQVDGVTDVSANAVSNRVRLRWLPEKTALSTVLQRLAALGYRPHLSPGEALERERLAERRQWVLRLGVAGLASMQSMMFAEALYLDFDQQMSAATRDFLRWIAFLVATPVVFYAGWPFLIGMARELRARHLGMDTLIGGSVLLAYLGSLVETLRGGPHVWIDAAVMFVFLLLAARGLETFARQRANAGVETLARARPALAWRLDDDDHARQVPTDELRVGDRLRVDVGEALAADGLLLDAGEFDESLLTGESRPVVHRPGDAVLAGSHCRVGPVRLQVTRIGEDTRLSQLVRLVEQAQDQRPRVARLADGVASRFVSGLLLAAAVVFLIWWQFAPERAFEVMLAVLVVSCPCALSMAVPAALAAANGALARLGVLALGADTLEDLAGIDVLLLDKTGTLTEGTPQVVDCETFAALDGLSLPNHAGSARQLAAALEQGSGHPLAAAFPDPGEFRASDLHTVVGQGVEGSVGAWRLRIGQAAFCGGSDDEAIWLSRIDAAGILHPLARFRLADRPRADAAQAIAALGQLGIRVELLSGDSAQAVADAARRLGIEQALARQTPEGKLQRLRHWQDSGHRVAMLGDGVNDAPVLAGANVAIAMGSGAALAHRSADLVLLGESLMRIPQAIQIARRTRKVIRQNLVWATLYNVVALPFAALGWVTPWLAALGMALSSLLVTLNALRLARLPAGKPASGQGTLAASVG